MALPSPEWFRENSAKVLEFARSMRQGRVRAYGISAWSVGDSDPSDVDVRSVHELSRMHQWCAYALAAHIEPEQSHVWAQQFEHEISVFANQYSRNSVHWQFPMGNAIRVFSMLVAWDWLRRTGYENVETDRYVAARAAEHGMAVYLERESRGGLSTSHYAANLLGLMSVDLYVQGASRLPQRTDWLVEEFHRELPRQILTDGMVQEGSTGYHRHVVDIFTMMAMLMRGAGVALREDATERLARGLSALRQLELIGSPLIGDNDDGMALKLTGFTPDSSATFDAAALLGIRVEAPRPWRSFPEFGLDVWSGLLDVTLRNGSVGQFGKGGHAHHDQNSITVSVHGRPFIVDPGTSTYTSSATTRNHERSVHVHGTMWPVDLDQGYINRTKEGLFWLPEFDVKPRMQKRSASTWVGEVRHRNGTCHIREVAINEDVSRISCADRLTGADGATLVGELILPLASEVVANMHEDHAVLISGPVSLILSWQGASASLRNITISPTFGVRVPSKAIVLSGNSISWVLGRS